jgi:hypothetical protein
MVKLQVLGNNSKTVNNIFYKFDDKRAIIPRWVIRCPSKLQGR